MDDSTRFKSLPYRKAPTTLIPHVLDYIAQQSLPVWQRSWRVLPTSAKIYLPAVYTSFMAVIVWLSYGAGQYLDQVTSSVTQNPIWRIGSTFLAYVQQSITNFTSTYELQLWITLGIAWATTGVLIWASVSLWQRAKNQGLFSVH